jgi:phospholipid-binding lipoprotein MlaA
LGILAVVDKRARHAEEIRLRDQAALDPYLFTREAYWQHRENLVFDGKPPVETYDNLFIDDELSDRSETSSSNEPCPEESIQNSSTQ